MFEFWSVNNVAFTVIDYPLSYIELFGTILYLWSVWLMARRDILTWPVGIVSVLLYMALFYQIRLYSDALEQIYYLFVSLYGWWRWKTPQVEGQILQVRYSPSRKTILAAVVTIMFSFALGTLMSRVHRLFPTIFEYPASFPYLDAITTVMSFTAMWLMAQKYIESWYYWIIVDLIGIGLYYVKEINFVALLYVILLAMAIRGLVSWSKAAKKKKSLGAW